MSIVNFNSSSRAHTEGTPLQINFQILARLRRFYKGFSRLKELLTSKF